MSDNITVHINLNGVAKTMDIPLTRAVTVNWVKDEVRTCWKVSGGSLSSREDKLELALSLNSGAHYYFLEFEVAQPVPPPAG